MKKLLLSFVLAVPLFAQQQPQTTALKAARLFDGTSDNVIANATVVVTGNRIGGVNVAIPAGAEVIDLGDVTLLPGFIDAHVHLTFESGDNFYLDFFQSVMRQPAEQAFYAGMYAKKTLEAGFTTVRNVGAGDYAHAAPVTAALTPGPRILTAVHAIGATGGHGDGDPIPPARGVPQQGPIDGVCNGADACRAAVRYQIKYAADVIKFMPSGGVLSPSDPVDAPELSQDEMNAIVEEAHHWGRKVAAHCHGDAAAKMAIAAGVDSIEPGALLKADTLPAMHDKGVYLVPTLLAGAWLGPKIDTFPAAIANKAKAAMAARDVMFRAALKTNVKIAFGTDSGVSPHGRNALEFSLMTDRKSV